MREPFLYAQAPVAAAPAPLSVNKDAAPVPADILRAAADGRVEDIEAWMEGGHRALVEDHLAGAIGVAMEAGSTETVARLMPLTRERAESGGWLRPRPNWTNRLQKVLIQAVDTHNVACMALMLPVVNAKDDDSLLLTMAAGTGCVDMVQLLLPHSNPRDMCSRALFTAATHGHGEVFDLLWEVSSPEDAMTLAMRRGDRGPKAMQDQILRRQRQMSRQESQALADGLEGLSGIPARSRPRV